jgi:hypothetical protein
MDAPIPVISEHIPQRPMTSASREKIFIEPYDEGKIFVPSTFEALSPPPPLQAPSMSHFSWGSTARPATSNGDAHAQSSRSYRDILPSVNRPTLFDYVQSRHEYSKARRLNFHFRSPSGMTRQNMQVDPTNTNPSVFAAELPGGQSTFEGHAPVETPSEIHPARQYHFYPAPALHNPHSPSGGRSRSLSSKSSRGRMGGASTPAPSIPSKSSSSSSKAAFFQAAFGQCFGRRS